jgi:hypothetical protein
VNAERAPVGKTRDGGWQIGVSATVDQPVKEIWDSLTSTEGIGLWVGHGVEVLRGRCPDAGPLMTRWKGSAPRRSAGGSPLAGADIRIL